MYYVLPYRSGKEGEEGGEGAAGGGGREGVGEGDRLSVG